jgi:hypothetical protein
MTRIPELLGKLREQVWRLHQELPRKDTHGP